MPNWCSNTIVVSGEAVDIKLFKEWLDDGKALLTKINPTPQVLVDTVAGYIGDPDEQKKLEEKSAANVKEFGYANWYDWNIGNWGTKWDVDVDIDDISSSSEEVVMSFDSAWSPPINAMVSLSEMFPNLSIRHSYLEEGCGFVGVTTIQAGCAADICHNDSNTEEWKEMARNEFGWEPWEDDEDESEENEEVKVADVPKPAKKPAKKKVKKVGKKKKPAKKAVKK